MEGSRIRVKHVSLVDQLKLEFKGNLLAGSIACGDIDTDRVEELIVGTIDGELYIYKPNKTNISGYSLPYFVINNLGTITLVLTGTFYNDSNKVSLLVINCEGYVYFIDNLTDTSTNNSTFSSTPLPTPTLFNLPSAFNVNTNTSFDEPTSNFINNNNPNLNVNGNQLYQLNNLNFIQEVVTNVTCGKLKYINGQATELILGTGDRTVCKYKVSVTKDKFSLTLISKVKFNDTIYNLDLITVSDRHMVLVHLTDNSSHILDGSNNIITTSSTWFKDLKVNEMLNNFEEIILPCFVLADTSTLIKFKKVKDELIYYLITFSICSIEHVESIEINFVDKGIITFQVETPIVGYGILPISKNSRAPHLSLNFLNGITLLLNVKTKAAVIYQLPNFPVLAFKPGYLTINDTLETCLFYVTSNNCIDCYYSLETEVNCDRTSLLVPFLKPQLKNYEETISKLVALLPGSKSKRNKNKGGENKMDLKMATLFQYLLYRDRTNGTDFKSIDELLHQIDNLELTE